jgi:hypothetical protein
MTREELINLVLAQIVEDVEGGDLTAIEELLKPMPTDTLLAFLPEEQNLTNVRGAQ